MFSKFFKKKAEPVRVLEHPKDLKKGDMLQMIDSFALPPQLKGQTLHLIDVNTYQYEYETEYEYVLKGDTGGSIFLVVENNDGEEFANFSIKIQRSEVEALFDLDQFAEIFDSDDLVTIKRINDVDGFERWTTTSYVQESHPSTGYYYEEDYRGRTVPKDVEDGGEPVECINLSSPDDNFSVNIEVWDDGETDISLTLTRPLSDIVDLFPGN
ncbi:MAG: DUF4178 domain-containing protein [Algicola sp.]|nr:DUF4178 domain-containing protein [Algicola sp.]